MLVCNIWPESQMAETFFSVLCFSRTPNDAFQQGEAEPNITSHLLLCQLLVNDLPSLCC